MSVTPVQPPGENRLLALLPREVREQLAPHLTLLELGLRHGLYKPNEPIEHVYFPLSGVCSLVITMADGTIFEVATVGNEGMVGLPVFLGTESIPGDAFVQVAGQAFQLPAEVLRQETATGGAFHELLHRYTQTLLNQISQTAVCNRAHSIQQRCGRWLLMTHDRMGAAPFTLTQEFLGQMLGVRRASVSAVASGLQQAGVIRYSRGVITVTDRAGLERVACECYRIVRAEFDRLLGPS
ncbi:MAG TPA: Crp/Fnr family transcriptional regulator [Chloroflexota bacterium]|nr:Crp/Fnr family transcriptional regulator [Chloroflexota bacterium]